MYLYTFLHNVKFYFVIFLRLGLFYTTFFFLFLSILLTSELSKNPLTFIHYLNAYADQVWQGDDMQQVPPSLQQQAHINLSDKERLHSSHIGTYLSRWVYFKKLELGSDK